MNNELVDQLSTHRAYERWLEFEDSGMTISSETSCHPIDKYEIANFARDDFPRFLGLVSYLSPRDQEIMLCFAVLQKRPTDISRIFGKARQRAQEDIHKAAHKLAGLIRFGSQPGMSELDAIFQRHNLGTFGHHSFAACVWQYARCRDFSEVSRLIGTKGLRQQMLRAFKILHAAEGRDEGLLAGWILWLVDGSDPRGKGWSKRKRIGREHRLGPVAFHSNKVQYGYEGKQVTELGIAPTGRGGQGQRPATLKVTRRMKFILRGMNV